MENTKATAVCGQITLKKNNTNKQTTERGKGWKSTQGCCSVSGWSLDMQLNPKASLRNFCYPTSSWSHAFWLSQQFRLSTLAVNHTLIQEQELHFNCLWATNSTRITGCLSLIYTFSACRWPHVKKQNKTKPNLKLFPTKQQQNIKCYLISFRPFDPIKRKNAEEKKHW